MVATFTRRTGAGNCASRGLRALAAARDVGQAFRLSDLLLPRTGAPHATRSSPSNKKGGASLRPLFAIRFLTLTMRIARSRRCGCLDSAAVTNEFDDRHWCVVAAAGAELDDARVASCARLKALAELNENFLDEINFA